MKQNNQDQTRRGFLKNLGIIGALVVAIGLFFKNMLLYVLPEKKEITYHKYLVGKKDDIPVGKAKEITLDGKPVFVVHLKEGFKVFSGVCTHLGCIVRWEEQKGRFYCPCHGGIFSKSGEVIGGPPPKPLNQFDVEIDNKLVFIKVKDKTEGPWV
jgi:cytochrome b6-f complex iron-sulfur subunit